jgi:50S ribosomal protein L16 3-hydroxylase
MTIDVHAPTALLGGLSPRAFMRRHWQRRPLLVRQAWPGVQPPLSRQALFELAGREGVQARLVSRAAAARAVVGTLAARVGRGAASPWQVRHGPMPRRGFPPLARPGWTLLVQGLDLHVQAAHAMLAPFRFVPAARLDDLMVSWASPGGGVGPHADSYDVFLLQVQGRRRWRVAPPGQTAEEVALIEGLPLKILRRFEPVHDWVLGPGDMLYLPPGWGHDGVAEGGDCMTCSVGFRAPAEAELARELLQRLGDEAGEQPGGARLYTDAAQPATEAAGAIPAALRSFATRALAKALRRPGAVDRALGEWLSEPKPQVWFDAGVPVDRGRGLRLDARTRMLYDAQHLFVNGESCRVGGRDARLLRKLADARRLNARDAMRLSPPAWTEIAAWAAAGWLHADAPPRRSTSMRVDASAARKTNLTTRSPR